MKLILSFIYVFVFNFIIMFVLGVLATLFVQFLGAILYWGTINPNPMPLRVSITYPFFPALIYGVMMTFIAWRAKKQSEKKAHERYFDDEWW